MSGTITIRAGKSLREALALKAEAEHKTVSEVIREILEESLIERPLAEKIGKLRGNLRVAEPSSTWQVHIRDRNWRS